MLTEIQLSPLTTKVVQIRYISFNGVSPPFGINQNLSKTSCLSAIHGYSMLPASAASTHIEDVNNLTAQKHKIHQSKNSNVVKNTLLPLFDGIKLFTFRFCFIWSF